MLLESTKCNEKVMKALELFHIFHAIASIFDVFLTLCDGNKAPPGPTIPAKVFWFMT